MDNDTVAHPVDGPLDVEALKVAARVLLRRHADLRAGFVYEDVSQPVQIILVRPGGLSGRIRNDRAARFRLVRRLA